MLFILVLSGSRRPEAEIFNPFVSLLHLTVGIPRSQSRSYSHVLGPKVGVPYTPGAPRRVHEEHASGLEQSPKQVLFMYLSGANVRIIYVLGALGTQHLSVKLAATHVQELCGIKALEL